MAAWWRACRPFTSRRSTVARWDKSLSRTPECPHFAANIKAVARPLAFWPSTWVPCCSNASTIDGWPNSAATWEIRRNIEEAFWGWEWTRTFLWCSSIKCPLRRYSWIFVIRPHSYHKRRYTRYSCSVCSTQFHSNWLSWAWKRLLI